MTLTMFPGLLTVGLLGVALSQEISVYVDNGEYTVKEGLSADADVEASFIDSCMTTGWGRLHVQINDVSSSNATDAQRMFAAGVAEGYLTSKQIYQAYLNLVNTTFWDFTNGPSAALQNFVNTQSQWEQSMIANHSDDLYWQMVSLVLFLCILYYIVHTHFFIHNFGVLCNAFSILAQEL